MKDKCGNPGDEGGAQILRETVEGSGMHPAIVTGKRGKETLTERGLEKKRRGEFSLSSKVTGAMGGVLGEAARP